MDNAQKLGRALKGALKNESLDRLLQHFNEGYAQLLPEAAKHQLGFNLSSGLDPDVFPALPGGCRSA